MSVDVGTQLGSLEITALLGKGRHGRGREAASSAEVSLMINSRPAHPAHPPRDTKFGIFLRKTSPHPYP
jgi:hypothetical protein